MSSTSASQPIISSTLAEYIYVIMAVRRNCEDGFIAMPMAGKDVASVLLLEPQAKFIPMHAESVCLFCFAKYFFHPISFLALYSQRRRHTGKVYFSFPHIYKHTLTLAYKAYFHSLCT